MNLFPMAYPKGEWGGGIRASYPSEYDPRELSKNFIKFSKKGNSCEMHLLQFAFKSPLNWEKGFIVLLLELESSYRFLANTMNIRIDFHSGRSSNSLKVLRCFSIIKLVAILVPLSEGCSKMNFMRSRYDMRALANLPTILSQTW